MPWRELEIPTDDERRALDAEFRGKARFLVDENAGAEVAEALMAMGYNAVFANDVGLRGRSDEDVFAAAWKDDRIIVTHDDDFLDNRRFPPHRNPGVLVVRPGSDGHADDSLMQCLLIATMIAGENAAWFKGKKIDFASQETLTISTLEGRTRYQWPRHQAPQVWED